MEQVRWRVALEAGHRHRGQDSPLRPDHRDSLVIRDQEANMNITTLVINVQDHRAEWFAKWQEQEREQIRQEYIDQSSRTAAGSLAPLHVEHEGEQQ